MASFALEHLTFSYPGQTRPALDDLTARQAARCALGTRF